MADDQIPPEVMSLLKGRYSDEEIARNTGLTLLDVLALRAAAAARPLRETSRDETLQ